MNINVTASKGVLSEGNRTTLFKIAVPKLGALQYVHLPFDHFHRRYGAPEDVAADLLVVAGIVYTIDRLIPRAESDDGWTRKLAAEIPVGSVETWQAHAQALQDMLCFLTGDQWRISFKRRRGPIYHGRKRRLSRITTPNADEVALFSGGSDSFIGALDWLEQHEGHLALVGHRDLGSGAGKIQKLLQSELARKYPGRTHLVDVRIGPLSSHENSTGPYCHVNVPDQGEATTRSRSFLFLALAAYIARRQDRTAPVAIRMSENGLIALNPSLTPSRVGSCSTRTAHPHFLKSFEELITGLGMPHVIDNPYAGRTKGQMIEGCNARTFAAQHIGQSVSCAHPNRRQGWKRRTAGHCGYCVPCLYRRAALYRVGLDVGTEYGFDVLAGELTLDRDVATDARALLSWLCRLHSGETTIPQTIRRMDRRAMEELDIQALVREAVNELTDMVRSKACTEILKWTGM